jgi:hypothetical protein
VTVGDVEGVVVEVNAGTELIVAWPLPDGAAAVVRGEQVTEDELLTAAVGVRTAPEVELDPTTLPSGFDLLYEAPTPAGDVPTTVSVYAGPTPVAVTISHGLAFDPDTILWDRGEPVEVHGAPGVLDSGSATWSEDGSRVEVAAPGLDRDTLLQVADGLEPVAEATWDQVLDRTGSTAPVGRAPEGWQARPPGSLAPRVRQVAVAAGDDLFVWGGDGLYGGVEWQDGARFRSSEGRWHPLPPAPLEDAYGEGVWTGEEVVVLTSGDEPGAAAYSPGQDRWRSLLAPTLDGQQPEAAVWIDGRVVVVGTPGGRGPWDDRMTAAAFDPATDRWTELAPPPVLVSDARLVVDGESVVLFGGYLDENNAPLDGRQNAAARLDPATGEWQELAPAPLSPNSSAITGTGDGLVAWDYQGEAARYDADRDRWRPLPDLPVDTGECYVDGGTVGGTVLVDYCGQFLALDENDRWRLVTSTPRRARGSPVLAGSGVVHVWGGCHEGCPNTYWAADLAALMA